MFKTKKEQPVAATDSMPGSDVQYTSGDVARIAGVSLRQLQWWDERNVVSPLQEGHRRVYRQQEVIEVSVIAELRRNPSDYRWQEHLPRRSAGQNYRCNEERQTADVFGMRDRSMAQISACRQSQAGQKRHRGRKYGFENQVGITW